MPGERLHAYSPWPPEQARLVAHAADAAFAAGVIIGSLQGVPVSIKDLFAASGYPCFAGSSRRLPADPWERDGPLVAALCRQLGVIMGKAHMVEFAFGGTGHNSHWGAPYNPWDAAAHRSVGGSSSGAGVSLLEGSALLACGNDTAGSVRIPASMTGTVGLEVTLGRWSTEGVVPLSSTFDTPRLLARSVSDASAVPTMSARYQARRERMAEAGGSPWRSFLQFHGTRCRFRDDRAIGRVTPARQPFFA